MAFHDALRHRETSSKYRECCEKPEKGNKYAADELKVYIRKQKEIRKQREIQDYEARQEVLEAKKQRLRELDVKCKQIAMTKRLEKKSSVPSSCTQYQGGSSSNGGGSSGIVANIPRYSSNTKSIDKSSVSSSKPKVKRISKFTSGYTETELGTELKPSKSNCKLEREAANFIFKEFENIVRRECRNILKNRTSPTSVSSVSNSNTNNNNNATVKVYRNSSSSETKDKFQQQQQVEKEFDEQQQQQFLQTAEKLKSRTSNTKVDKGVGTSFLLNEREIEIHPGKYDHSSDSCSSQLSDYVKPIHESRGFHSLLLNKNHRKQQQQQHKHRKSTLPYVNHPGNQEEYAIPESTKHEAASKIQAAYKSYKIRSILSEAKLRAYKSFHANNINSININNHMNNNEHYHQSNSTYTNNNNKKYDRSQLENLSSESMVQENKRRKMTFYKVPSSSTTTPSMGDGSQPEKPYDIQNRYPSPMSIINGINLGSSNNNNNYNYGTINGTSNKPCPIKSNPEDIPGYIPPPAGFSASTPRAPVLSPRIVPLLRLKPIDEPFPKQVLDNNNSFYNFENQNSSPAVSPLKLINSISKFQFPYSLQATSSKDLLPSTTSIKVINDNVLNKKSATSTTTTNENEYKNHQQSLLLSSSSTQQRQQQQKQEINTINKKSSRIPTSTGAYCNGEISSSKQKQHQKLSTTTYMDLPDPAFSTVLQEKVRLLKADSIKYGNNVNNHNIIKISKKTDAPTTTTTTTTGSNDNNNQQITPLTKYRENIMTTAVATTNTTTTTSKSKSPTRRTQMNAVSKATEQIKKKIVEAKQILEDYKQELLKSSSMSSITQNRTGGGVDDLPTYESDFDTEIHSQSQSLSQIQNSLFGHDSEILSSVALDNNNIQIPIESKKKTKKNNEVLSSASSSVSSLYQNQNKIKKSSKDKKSSSSYPKNNEKEEKFVGSQSESSEYEEIQNVSTSQQEQLKIRHKQQQANDISSKKSLHSSSRRPSLNLEGKKERSKSSSINNNNKMERDEELKNTLSDTSSNTNLDTTTTISSSLKSHDRSSKKRSLDHEAEISRRSQKIDNKDDLERKQISREVKTIVTQRFSDNSEIQSIHESHRSSTDKSKSHHQQHSISKNAIVSIITGQQQQFGSISSASSNLPTEDLVYESDFDTDLQSISACQGGQNSINKNNSNNANNNNNSHQNSQILSSIVVDFVLSEVQDSSIADSIPSNNNTVGKERKDLKNEKLKSLSKIDESLPKSDGVSKKITQIDQSLQYDDEDFSSISKKQLKKTSKKDSQLSMDLKEIEELDTNVSFSLASNIPEDIPYDMDFDTEIEEETQTSPSLLSSRKDSEIKERMREEKLDESIKDDHDISSIALDLIQSEIEEENRQLVSSSSVVVVDEDSVQLDKSHKKDQSTSSISIQSSMKNNEIDDEIEKKLEWVESLMQGSKSISSKSKGKKVTTSTSTSSSSSSSTNSTITTSTKGKDGKKLIEDGKEKDISGKIIEQMNSISCASNVLTDDASIKTSISQDNIHIELINKDKSSEQLLLKLEEDKSKRDNEENEASLMNTDQKSESCQTPQYSEQFESKIESSSLSKIISEYKEQISEGSSQQISGTEKKSVSSQSSVISNQKNETDKNQHVILSQQVHDKENELSSNQKNCNSTSFKSEISQIPEVSEKSIIAELSDEDDNNINDINDNDDEVDDHVSQSSFKISKCDKSIEATISETVESTKDKSTNNNNNNKAVLASSIQKTETIETQTNDVIEVNLSNVDESLTPSNNTTSNVPSLVIQEEKESEKLHQQQENSTLNKTLNDLKITMEGKLIEKQEEENIVDEKESCINEEKVRSTAEEEEKEKEEQQQDDEELQEEEYTSASYVSNFHVEDVVYESDFDTDVQSDLQVSTNETEIKKSTTTTTVSIVTEQEQVEVNEEKEDKSYIMERRDTLPDLLPEKTGEGDYMRMKQIIEENVNHEVTVGDDDDHKNIIEPNLKFLIEDKGKLEEMIGRIINRMIKEVTESRNETLKETPIQLSPLGIILPETVESFKIQYEKKDKERLDNRKQDEEDDDDEEEREIDVEEEWFEDDLGTITSDPAEEESLKREAAEIVAEQLRIENEIRQLEALQAKVPQTLLQLQDVPDKPPPPPYSSYSMKAFSISYTQKQLEELIVTQVDKTWNIWRETGQFPKMEMDSLDDNEKLITNSDINTAQNYHHLQNIDGDNSKETSGDTPLNQNPNSNQICDIKDVSVLSTRAFNHLLFDLIQDTIKETLQIEDLDSPIAKEYVDRIRPGSLALAAQKMRIPKTREELIGTVLNKAKNLLPCTILANSVRQRLTKWTSRPRDLVDEILAEELIQEDREWTDSWPEEIVILDRWNEKYSRRAIREVLQAFRTVYS